MKKNLIALFTVATIFTGTDLNAARKSNSSRNAKTQMTRKVVAKKSVAKKPVAKKPVAKKPVAKQAVKQPAKQQAKKRVRVCGSNGCYYKYV